MADVKISGLPVATTPLAGTEVLPIVQGGQTRQVANNDLRPKQIQSNATSGVLQIAGPTAATTRVMTTPDANFTAARIDAAQTFTGAQVFSSDASINGLTVGKGGGSRSLNTAVGVGALAANTTGQYNSTFGYQAGGSAVGNYLTAVGYLAGQANTDSSGNCFFGYEAGKVNSSGGLNVFMGASAGTATTTGGNNVFIGGYAGIANIGGGTNAGIGGQALRANTSGGGNTALGFRAGWGANSPNANTTGTNNTYVGFDAVGSANNNTNETVIGYNAVGNGSNTTTIGNSSTTNTVIPAGNATLTNGNVIIGTSGKGIDFSATPGTGTSELFADYEEGTWTPTDTSGAGLSLTIVSATYTKIGRLVTLQAEITYPTTANATGAILGGFPYTAASNGAASFYAGGIAGPMAQIGSALYPANSVGASISNATFSAKTVYLTVSYRN